jgi:hypothetical protein
MKSALVLLVLTSAAFAGDSIQLHPLNENRVDGSGCSFWLSGTDGAKDYLQWDFLSEGWVNFGAEDIQLSLLKDQQEPYPQGQTSLGRNHELSFAAPRITVVVRAKVTWVCPEDDEACEAWHEAGEIQANFGGKTFSAPVNGICGS